MLQKMSDYDQYKKEQRELAETRKLKLSTSDGGAGLAVTEEYHPIVPKTFKEKWSNYWYHYKFRTFAIAIGAVLIFSFAWSIIFATKYDSAITFVAEYPVDSIAGDLKRALSGPDLMKDTTGNGVYDLDIATIQLDLNGKFQGSPQMNEGNVVKLTARVSALEGFIFVVDQFSYEYLKKFDMDFVDLSEMVDKSHLQLGNDRYSIKGTKLEARLGLDGIGNNPENALTICFFDYHTLDEKRKAKSNIIEQYESDWEYFQKLLAYE